MNTHGLTLLVISALLGGAFAQAPATGTSTPEPPKRKRLTYTPPSNPGGVRIDGDGGSRGPEARLPSIYVLAPNHTALTTQEQPSLFWFQSLPADVKLELTLIEPKVAKPALKLGSEKAGKAGIHRIPLSRYGIKLKPGVAYKWTVSLIPDAANRSQDVIASGVIQRVDPKPELSEALKSAVSPEAKAEAYASHGVWYDALEALTDAIDKSPKDSSLRSARAGLFAQVGLKEPAKAEAKAGD